MDLVSATCACTFMGGKGGIRGASHPCARSCPSQAQGSVAKTLTGMCMYFSSLSRFPFYYELKIAFVAWLLSPYTKGSSLLYRKFVHPTLSSKEKVIYAAQIFTPFSEWKNLRTINKKGQIILLQETLHWLLIWPRQFLPSNFFV